MRKLLPRGTWFFFNVADQTTEEQIVENFRRVGITITPDRIKFSEATNLPYRRAIVSIADSVILAVMQARLSSVSLNGKQITLVPPQVDRDRKPRERILTQAG